MKDMKINILKDKELELNIVYVKDLEFFQGQFDKCNQCDREGKFYPFENKRGIPSDCNKCKGTRYLYKQHIANNFVNNNIQTNNYFQSR